MFKEILKIIPQLDSAGLSSMEKTLNGRFARVAKTFGRGLKNAVFGGGIVAVATSLIDKLLNPLKEVQESIDRSLNKGDDLVTYAKQFNTTPGNLARLQAFGKASGLEAEGVRLLLGKFQGALAENAADPTKSGVVANFQGRKDTAEAFFEFIQSLQKVNKTNPLAANLVQQQVFGEKQILKASEFLNADFKTLGQQIGGPSSQQLSAAAGWTGQMSDNRDVLRAGMELQDIVTKASKINDNLIAALHASDQFALNRENSRLNSAENIKKMALMVDKVSAMVEELYLKGGIGGILKTMSKVDQLVDLFKTGTVWDAVNSDLRGIGKSRAARGITPGAGKDK
jgi:hypothetical protein